MDPQKFPPEKNSDETEDSNRPSSNDVSDDVSLAQDKASDDASNANNQPVDNSSPTDSSTSSESESTPEDTTPVTPFAPAETSETPDATATPPVPGIVSPKRKKMTMLAVIVGIVLLVLGGGAALAYFGYYVPNKPDNVLNTALSNFFSEEKAKTIHFDGEVSITSKADDQTIKGTFEGASSGEGQFDFTFGLDVLITTIQLDMRSVDGKSIYLRLSGLEGLPELLAADPAAGAYAPLIDKVNNQWFEINESLLKEWSGTDQLTLSQEDMDKLAKAYQENMFLKVKVSLPDEKVHDTDSYHYKVVIDKTALKGFLNAVKAADLATIQLTTEQVNLFNDALDQSSLDFDKYPFDVWIAKDTKMFSKFAFSYSDDEASLLAVMNILSYNKPVEVEKPEDAKSILEVFSSLFTDPALQQSLQEEFSGDNSGVSL